MHFLHACFNVGEGLADLSLAQGSSLELRGDCKNTPWAQACFSEVLAVVQLLATV